MKASAGRILMLVQNRFPSDPRVRNESALLRDQGYEVTVICLKRNGEKTTEVIRGIRVYRMPELELFKKAPGERQTAVQRQFTKVKALVGYISEYAYFTTGCLLLSLYVAMRHGVDVIHAHNPPDTLFLVALPFKLLGKKFVFDHHDLAPELYQSRYRTRGNVVLWGLLSAEKCSLKLADITIATNESYKRVHIQRGGRRPERCFVVRNGPGPDRMELVSPSERLRQMGKSIFCYIGCLNPQDGVDYLLRALACLTYGMKRTDYYCVIMGSGDSLDVVVRTIATHHLSHAASGAPLPVFLVENHDSQAARFGDENILSRVANVSAERVCFLRASVQNFRIGQVLGVTVTADGAARHGIKPARLTFTGHDIGNVQAAFVFRDRIVVGGKRVDRCAVWPADAQATHSAFRVIRLRGFAGPSGKEKRGRAGSARNARNFAFGVTTACAPTEMRQQVVVVIAERSH